MRAFAAALALGATVAMTAASAETRYSMLQYSDLDGWIEDDHVAALTAFMETCPDLDDDEWASLCALGQKQQDARAFFELFFRPILIEDDRKPLFTGYFEPELNGSLQRTGPYQYPLDRKPVEVTRGEVWYTRSQIENDRLLDGRDLEIAWIDDPVDVFFLQIQGSGRVHLPDGGKIRVGYGGRNGHEYKSVGNELVRRGIFDAHQVSASVIRNWVRQNPDEGRRLLQHNPSFIFFREVSTVPAADGPLGAMNRSITTLRSIAVDPEYTPLGAPVWVEKLGEEPLNRLMIAQDTGSAIKGAQRADIFYGTGDEAGKTAGRVRDGGRMVVLLPIQKAFELAPGG
ncbi:MAG: MltA domain-containing protein [Pseudomonadota bacterium]